MPSSDESDRTPQGAMNQPPLKRLAKVGREIAIIVVGVSVALGADALYDRYQENGERTRVLRALVMDLQADSASYAAALLDSLETGATRALLKSLADPSVSLSRVELARAVRESVIFPSGQKESATYRELTITGRIALIEDPTLRRTLLRYYARPFTGFTPEMWSAHLSNVYYPYDRSLRKHLGADYVGLMRCVVRPGDAEYEDCILSFTDRLDPTELAADSDFMESLVGMATGTVRLDLFTRNEARAHQHLSEQIRIAVPR